MSGSLQVVALPEGKTIVEYIGQRVLLRSEAKR